MVEPIYVDYEYGNLREVIVGSATQLYTRIDDTEWAEEALAILPESEANKARERAGMRSTDMPKHELLEAEHRELIKILDRFDVTVHRLTDITDDMIAENFGREWLAQGYLQTYARDPIFVVGDNVIELSPGMPVRRGELLGFVDLFKERLPGSGAKWYQMPSINAAPMVHAGYTKEASPALEGGDLLVLGKTVLAGTSVNPVLGSSAMGVEWLSQMLGPQGYDVQRVPMINEMLHLDVCLSIPRDGLAIACTEAMIDGLPPYLDGWDIIEVPLEEAHFLACNGLPIDPDNYILGYNDTVDGSRVQNGLEAHGITVHRIAYGNHTEDGGSIRCSTHPLVRRLA